MELNTTKLCPVCENGEDNSVLNTTEMMLNMNDEFKYLQCSNCGTLSLMDIPVNMEKYYPTSYYSFVKKAKYKRRTVLESIKKYLRKSSMKGHLDIGNFVDKQINRYRPVFFIWLKKNLVTLDSKILDVGCGNGFLITEMEKYGFTNLTGIDLYTGKEHKDQHIKIYKTDIHSLQEEKFDLIMYHHSFEHILNPHFELQEIHNKLKDDGTLILRVPVCDSFAFRHYQNNWVQLDAPRHYFLYTKKSMQILSKNNGFDLYDFYCDSNSFQFIGSECYLGNKPISNYKEFFTEHTINNWEKQSKQLNELEDGDQVCFYLKKIQA